MKNELRVLLAGLLTAALPVSAATTGWLDWRGPHQNGSSDEKNLPAELKLNSPNHLWTAPLSGASTPVISRGRLFIMGYVEEGGDLQEVLACFDAATGKKLWQRGFSDFLSDIIYKRYASSSPAIDPDTGNVYMQGTQGILAGFKSDGTPLWQHSLMEEFGRLTFPNGRTVSPIVEGDLVIVHGITANWGAQGPASDRFYAFEKNTGDLVWSSTPGDRPKDSSFSHSYVTTSKNGKRLLISTTGDGSIVGVNARTGDPLWRVPIAKAGINASVVVHNDDKVIAIYGTPYEPGQMVAMKIPDVEPVKGTNGPVVVERSQVEIWSKDISSSTSSPILAGDRVYVVLEKGDLCAVSALTGEIFWKLKIGIEQRNSCPLYADGKLYVPILDDPDKGDAGGEAGTTGAFYVIQPGDKEGKILSKLSLQGRCFGSPAVCAGRVYIQTTKNVYCFGNPGSKPAEPAFAAPKLPKTGPAAQLQIIPSEVLLRPGQAAAFRVRSLDENGYVVKDHIDPKTIKWAAYIPATAKVKATMKGEFNADGKLVAANEAVPSAGAFEATMENLHGTMRGRVLPFLPIKQDFESFKITEKHETEPDTMFAYPPLPWIGARFKFEVREKEGNKMLVKTIDNRFFQRATVFMGDANASNYTIEADVMSEGNRRKMSEVGLICQRYLVVLKGNEQKLEINSNLERLRVPRGEEPSNFKWSPNTWYRLKARVDVAKDGSGVIRAKAWKKGEAEPEAWTLEVPHQHAHTHGAPGLFGFAPQDVRVFVDNIQVTPN